MFCTNCGKQIPDNTKFCPYCGKENRARQTVPAADDDFIPDRVPMEAPRGTGTRPSPEKRNNHLPLIIGLAVFFIIILAAAAILLLSSAGKKASSSKEETSEISSEAENADENTEEETEGEYEEPETEAEETEETENIIPPGSAEDEGNLFGNSHCYARMVSDGTYLYFRNALDQERTYWIKKGETEAYPLTDIYMKDLHYKDGWIYYSRTTEGDVAAGIRDNNIYRMKADGTGNTNLSNLTFDNPQCWLSFETMAQGKCFFVYTDGKGISIDIGYTPESGGSSVFLARIPGEKAVDNPCINVVENNVYFLETDGLHCVDINTRADRLIIPGFSCEEYMIYDGVIYFVTGARQGTPDGRAVLSRINLDNTDRQELFVSDTGTGFSGETMQVSIYQGEIYFLLTTHYPEEQMSGCLYTVHPDGTQAQKLMEDISWFNIIDHVLYYRYVDAANAAAPEYQFAPYYYTPFNDVKKGNGTAGRIELFDTAPYIQAAAEKTSSSQGVSSYGALPDNAKAPYHASLGQPNYGIVWIDGGNYEYADFSSSFIDRGSYYEMTNCTVSIPYTVPVSVMSQCRPGFSLPADGWVYTIREAAQGNAAYILYDSSSGYDEGYLFIRPDGTGYITLEDDYMVRTIVYQGSLFFSKDCRVYGYGEEAALVPIDLYSYMTEPHDFSKGYEYGNNGSGNFSIYGYPVFDSETGLIIEYREQFTP